MTIDCARLQKGYIKAFRLLLKLNYNQFIYEIMLPFLSCLIFRKYSVQRLKIQRFCDQIVAAGFKRPLR